MDEINRARNYGAKTEGESVYMTRDDSGGSGKVIGAIFNKSYEDV